jgi:hypothetical protein
MTVTVQTDILASLQTLHGNVQRRFAELDRYRALQAIERTIADFPDLNDVTHSLGDIRDRVQVQLDGTPEFRALRSIERMLPELSDVLVLLNGTSNSEEISEPGEASFASESPVPESVVNAEAVDVAPDVLPAGDLDAAMQSPFETVAVDIETVATAAEPEQPQDLPHTDVDPAHVTTLDRSAVATTDDRHPPGPEIDARASEPVHVPSLADSVAQLIAQAAMPPRDPPAPSDWGAGTDAPERPQSPAERAA